MADRFIAFILLFSFSLPITVPTREYLFSDRSSASRSSDSAAMIAARISFPLNPCRPKNVNLEIPSRSLRPRSSILVWLPWIQQYLTFRILVCLFMA